MIRYEALEGATVCICAPVRAAAQVVEAERHFGLAGATVLAPIPPAPGGQLSAFERAVLIALHRRKISRADLVVVVDADGYVGAGTGREIAHALRLGIRVEFLADPLSLEVAPAHYSALIARTTTVVIWPASQAESVANGSILALTNGRGQAPGRVVWCRVVDLRTHQNLGELLESLDAGRTQPSLEAELATQHPDVPASQSWAVMELEVLGEPDPARAQAMAIRGARHRAATGTGLLVRDGDGRILLVAEPALPGGWRLPRGIVEGSEYPWEAASRATTELLGVPVLRTDLLDASMMHAQRLLVVDHLLAETEAEAAEEWVFDGGVIDTTHAQHIVAVTGDIARFAALGELPGLVAPRIARRIIAAMTRSADPDAPVALEHGFAPGQGPDWEWVEGDQLPPHLPVTQASVWAFAQDGRVLVQHRVSEHRFALPGGRREPGDLGLIGTAGREALEECQVVIDTARAVMVGYLTTFQDPRYPDGQVQVRFAAPIVEFLPIAPDADPELAGSRPAYRRLMTDVGRAAELLDYGPLGVLQADAAARAARERFGLPVDRPAAEGYRDQGDLGPADAGQGDASGTGRR